MELKRIRIEQVNVGARFRKEYGDIKTLGAKIKSHKRLLQPIIVSVMDGGHYRLHGGARRLRACREIGESMIDAVVVKVESELQALLIERDENERLNYSASEMVELGLAIEKEIGNRQGQKKTPEALRQEFVEVAGKKTAEIAGEAAGFKNPETYRQAKTVVANGTPELVEAMDKEEVTIADAASVAKEPATIQKKAVNAVRNGKAKTARAAATSAKSDADETPDNIVDALNHPVPDSCAEAFRNLDSFALIDSLCRQLQSSIDELSGVRGGEQLRTCLQPTGSEGKTINKSEHLNALKRDLKGTRPYAVCPWCAGKALKTCKGCSGAGWITKMTWDNADEQTRNKLKKGA